MSLPGGATATLDHFEIPVASAERIAAFLERVFGWRPPAGEAPAAGYLRLETGGEAQPAERQVRVGLLEEAGELLDRAIPVVRIEGEPLAACLERVVENEGLVISGPQAVDSGTWARFRDPDGNEWGLWSPR